MTREQLIAKLQSLPPESKDCEVVLDSRYEHTKIKTVSYCDVRETIVLSSFNEEESE